MELFRATAQGTQWIRIDESLRMEQKGLEKRSDMFPAENYGSLRQEIEACLNGREPLEDIDVSVVDGEIELLKKHAALTGVSLGWQEIP
jgi:hypothetical protein